MPTTDVYQQKISALGLDHLEIRASSVNEAKEALSRCRSLQKELRHMKKSIGLDIRYIRSEYEQKSAGAASGTSTVLSLFGKRALAGQVRADARRRLKMERDQAIQPFEVIKRLIEDLILQIDGGKLKLEKYIAEAKSKEQGAK